MLYNMKWEPLAPASYITWEPYVNSIKGWIAPTPEDMQPHKPVIGIDPGVVNIGICIIHLDFIHAYKISLGKVKEMHPHKATEMCFELAQMLTGRYPTPEVGIENSSFGDKYGKELMERTRAGFSLGFKRITGQFPLLIPPSTARKSAFGHGFQKGREVMTTIGPDASDAVGIALHTMGWRYTE